MTEYWHANLNFRIMHTYRDSLQKNFKEEYEKLNTEQRKAVDSIEGPVMVIAGPGTGKTQILAARIGKILLETDVLPYNILCLTYTDAGVVTMRRRLVQFIGADAYIYKRASGPYKKGDLKVAALENEKLKMERLRCAVNEFDNFQKLMHKNN